MGILSTLVAQVNNNQPTLFQLAPILIDSLLLLDPVNFDGTGKQQPTLFHLAPFLQL